MKYIYITHNTVILFITLSIIFIITPLYASAYNTTAQAAVSATNQTALFLIEYRFGLTQSDIYMPRGAVRDLAHDSMTKSVGYSVLLDENDVATEGTSSAFVLSNAAVVDDFYYVPAGTNVRFTLLVAYTVPADGEESMYSVQVTDLPFYVGEEKEYRKLNVSELKTYITPETELNDR